MMTAVKTIMMTVKTQHGIDDKRYKMYLVYMYTCCSFIKSYWIYAKVLLKGSHVEANNAKSSYNYNDCNKAMTQKRLTVMGGELLNNKTKMIAGRSKI